ncbi:MAG: PAS domain S-box protein [Candidatus Hydrogenedentes bacterium]|nr:PAS domain S-box protein [Candidatus Hydrogenedentota bacterium]
MTTCIDILVGSAEDIAKAAAEHTDSEAYIEPLTQVVQQLGGCLEDELPLDVMPLREAGADDALIGRLLRAAETEAIELFRASSNGKVFAGNVLHLRACIRKSLPPAVLNLETVSLYHNLVDNMAQTAHPDSQRLYDFLAGILHNIRDLVFVHDAAGNILYINDAGLAVVKYTREDLMQGLSIYDVVVSKYIDLVEERMTAPGGGNLSPFTIEVYSKDGERIPMEIDTRILTNHAGSTDVIVGISRDLRLERRFQTEIRRTNCYVETLLGISPHGVIIADADGSIRDANAIAAGLCGAPSVNALIGLGLCDLGERADASSRDLLERVVDARRDFRACVTFRTRFGKKLHCDVIAAPLELDDGSLDGVVMLLVDIAEQKSMQRELLQQEKMSALGEIVMRAAHELNNPLAGILGYAELLHQAVEKRSHKDKLERIIDEANRCRRIGENLLAFAKRGDRERLPCDINVLIQQAYGLFEYALNVDRIAVTLDLAPDLPQVHCDSQDVQRVFLNVINNAHQALLEVEPDRRRLTITSRTDRSSVQIVFADTGPGMDEETCAKVFQPFFTTRDVGEGIGLGLSVAYAMITNHGGAIEVESEPGRGATFTISLPIRA